MGARLFGQRWAALKAILMLALCFVCTTCALADEQRSLQVIDVHAGATSEEASNARTAFTKGQAVVRMKGGSTADFERLIGVRLSNLHAISEQSQAGSTGFKKKLQLQGVAAYRDSKGILRTMLSFSANARDGQKVDRWVAAARANPATALLGDPTPPSEAWTLLYTVTVSAGDGAGEMQSTDSIFRLNTTSVQNDFYMVYTRPQTQPQYTNIVGAASTCDGISFCGWHTIERDFTIGLSATTGPTTLVDHGPTGTISGSSVGFSIGASVGPDGPGVSAGFSASWNQPDVSTTDQSSDSTGQWQETFSFAGQYSCLPPGGGNVVPDTSKGTFLSQQGAIFQIPGGQSSFTASITQKSQFCLYVGPLWDYNGNNGTGAYSDTLTLQKDFLLGNPILQPRPATLTVPAGGSQPLGVSAYIPNSTQGVQWEISSNQSWLTVPTTACLAGGQIIPVSVASGTADGTKGTLAINTCTGFAAPAVASGPLLVDVTVGTPPASSAAGILFFGGNAAFPAEYYDLATRISVPVTPIQARLEDLTSTLLNTGNILIAGGHTAQPSLPPPTPVPVTASAELFDANLLNFASTGSMATARAAHTATALPDGKVLIVGGVDVNGDPLTSAELYDPATGTFSAAGNLTTARGHHTATLLAGSGAPTQVIVYGGFVTNTGDDLPDSGYEIWDESKNSFVSTGTMPFPVSNIPQPIKNGSSFPIVGGLGPDRSSTTREGTLDYANLTGSWTPQFGTGPSLNTPRSNATLTVLPNAGGLLVTGGETANGIGGVTVLGTMEISTDNSSTGSWNLTSGTQSCPGSSGCMLTDRSRHTATLLPNGTVLLAGGLSATIPSEIYNPVTNTSTEGPVIQQRIGHTATLVVTTGTSLIATPPSSTFGQKVHLAASVVSSVSAPTGTVQFLDGTTSLGTVQVSQGTAALDISTLAIGSHTLTAAYSGDAIASGSTSTAVTQQVSGATTTTSFSVNPNPSDFGSAVTLTASVSGANGPVTGTVVFSDSGKQIATANLANGTAQTQVSNLGIGQHSMSAAYSSSGSWEGSNSATIVQVVNAARISTTTTVNSTPNPSTSGQPVTFKAVVTPVSGTGVPGGSVDFLDGRTVLGTVNLVSGTASFPTSGLALGTHAITAVYSGNNGFITSTSSVLTQTVSADVKVATSTTLTATPNPSTAGSTVSLSATVSTTGSSSGSIPSGNVVFTDQTTSTALGAAPLSTVGGALVAVLNTAALTTSGTHNLVAVYGGDTNFVKSTSAPYMESVSGSGTPKITPTVDLTVNGSTSATVKAGDEVVFAVRVHAPTNYPVPTGSINVSDTVTGTSYGTATVAKDPDSNDGLASFSTSNIPAGTYTLVAVYGGDNAGQYYNGTQSNNTVMLTVNTSLGAAPPQPSLAISAVADPRNGTTMKVTLTLTNNGTAALKGITLNQVGLRTRAGSGQAMLTSPLLPFTVGDLAPGAASIVMLQLQVPESVRRLAISESGIFKDYLGTSYAINPGQVIFTK
jgi:hypothetical protein